MRDAREIPLEVKVFTFLFESIEAKQRGNLAVANKLIEIALRLTDEMPDEQAGSFRALGLCSLTLLRMKEGRTEEADKLREEAMRLVDQVSNVDPPGEQRFSQLMSALLMVLHEYRRAIPFCEMAVRRALQEEDPIEVAGMLTRQGHCYAFC